VFRQQKKIPWLQFFGTKNKNRKLAKKKLIIANLHVPPQAIQIIKAMKKIPESPESI
jgi:hypothetical protein